MPFEVVYDYTYDGIMRSVEDSYQRLGLAKLDILFVHDIGVYQHGAEGNAPHMQALRDSGYRALQALKADGTASAIGIGVNEKAVLIEALGFADWDVFLLAGRYTLLEQAPLDDLLPMCVTRGTSIVVGGPLNSGILAGRDTWNYAAAPPEVVARVKRIEAVCDAHNVPLAAAALQFPLAHPAVCAIIPGPRNAAEFEANVGLLQMKIPAGAVGGSAHGRAAAPRGTDAVVDDVSRRSGRGFFAASPFTAPSTVPRPRCRYSSIMNRGASGAPALRPTLTPLRIPRILCWRPAHRFRPTRSRPGGGPSASIAPARHTQFSISCWPALLQVCGAQVLPQGEPPVAQFLEPRAIGCHVGPDIVIGRRKK